MILTIYNQYQDDQSYPIWLVVTIDKDVWEKGIVYFSVHQDIVQKDMDEFPEEILSFSVYQEDLLLSKEIFGKVGIQLSQIKARSSEQVSSLPAVSQLLIRVIDLEEILTLSKVTVATD
ncbi:hypothetical protein [Brevibacillus centrosporus]|uniref:hypothetical protein n=1 Tax=Brevibacillus centrosporus TaxID=54910 RepID=UPI003985D7BF